MSMDDRLSKVEVPVFYIPVIYSSINYKLLKPYLRLVPE